MSLQGHFRLIVALIIYTALIAQPGSITASPSVVDSEPVSVHFAEVNPSTVSLSVEMESYIAEKVDINGQLYDRLSVGLEPVISREGWPNLPFIARSVLIPPQGGVHLEITGINSHIEEDMQPVLANNTGDDQHVNWVEEADGYRSQDGFWPPEAVTVGTPAILRGYRLVNIQVYPFQYNRQTGEMRVNEQVDFQLSFEGEGENVIENPDRPLQSMYAWRAVSQLVENPPEPPSRDDMYSGSYLFIAPNVNGVAAALEPLIEWRMRQGHRVAVETVANNLPAAGVADIIEEYYESDDPIEFVALVGDANGGAINISASNQYGDYDYTRLEGNDELPDIAIGRLSVHDVETLERVVNKIVTYETTPFMQDTDWFKQGAVVAGNSVNGLGTVLVAKYVRKELLAIGFTEVHHWYHTEDGNIGGDQPWLVDQFRWGISVLHYRAYQAMNQLSVAVIDNLPNREGRWPAVLAISCNTGDIVGQDGRTEHFFRARGGGLGAIGTATPGTHVQYNNIMAGGVWKGIYKDKLYLFGWGLNSGKYQLWRAYDNLDGSYISFMMWNNLVGDPASHIWTDIPREIAVNHEEQFSIGGNRLSFTVEDVEEEAPMPDALVCLYKEGELHKTGYTDNQGFVEFLIDPDALSEGDLMVTVTKHNILPYMGSIDVVEPDFYIGVTGSSVDDDNQGLSDGDDDGITNPGETVEIRVTLTNLGANQLQDELVMTVQSHSQWADVISDPVVVDNPPRPGQSVNAVFVAEVHPACPDAEELSFLVEVQNGDNLWNSLVNLSVSAPKIEINNAIIQGGMINRGDIRLVDFELENVGHKELERCHAILTSERSVVRVLNAEVEYDPIDVNRRERINGGLFRLRVHPFTITGMTVPLHLQIETEAGFVDEVTYILTIGEKGEGDPLGPDKYGYVCYDSGDEGWENCPVYDWIEIDGGEQGHDFRGTELDLDDRGDNQDESVVVQLPFEFQYYGEVFDRITVCTNGWIAFGDQSELADFRNRRIGQALGPNAQLCVWWDNLITPNNSNILVHYDDDWGIFIVEWNNVQRLVSGGVGAYETFEAILYDPARYPTSTHDGMIKFQYKDVLNQNIMARNDTPFCTIGIGNLDDSDGIEYTYWDQYPVGAMEIGDEMALLFVTESDFKSGVVEGFVTDFATGDPIATAEMLTSRGFWAESDENGFYRIEDVLIDDDFAITAYAQGWNDSTLIGFAIAEEETLTVDFSLLHPEFRSTENELGAVLPQGGSLEQPFALCNDGNGTLTWRVVKELREDLEIESWTLRETIPAGRITNDSYIMGAVFFDDHYYVSGKNGNDPNTIYIIDRDGNLVDSFIQPDENVSYGLRDLAWDGEWIWGSGSRTVFALTPEGDVAEDWAGPWSPNTNIAWDPERGILWLCGTTTDISGYDREGNRVIQDNLSRCDLRIYGLAYYQDDRDGYELYILHEDPETGIQAIRKMNPDTGDTMFVALIDPGMDGRPQAAFISNEYDQFSWVLAAVSNDGSDDRIDIWQVDSRKDWMSLDVESGTINAGEQQPLVLSLDATGLPEVTFDGLLIFEHNALGGETLIPVTLEVGAGAGLPDSRTLRFSAGWNMVSLNVDPEENDIEVMMAPLVEDGLLRIMKDGEGRFYAPTEGYNGIPGWTVSDGYQVNVTENAEIEIDGLVIASNAPIALEEGWNLKSYYPRIPIDATIALENISEQLVICKNGNGDFYMPEFGYNGIGFMVEGQGYLIKVNEDVDLLYSEGEDQIACSTLSPKLPPCNHFPAVAPGLENMSVLLWGEKSLAGWELGVFNSNGMLVGSGRFNSEGLCGVPVWGDDPATETVEGMIDGEPLQIQLWDGKALWFADILPVKGEPKWSQDGIFAGELTLHSALPEEFGISGAYPNPFNSATLLKYQLTETGVVKLTLYDQTGRLVNTVVDRSLTAGYYQVTIQADNLASGLYFAVLQQDGLRDAKKLMLLK